MDSSLILLALVIIAALVFEFINGFHDCANSIATVVATRVLSPGKAVIFGAALNFVGALLGVQVAKTIGSGIINSDFINLSVILCALIGAISWNLITWRLALPSSSSHALIGGLVGSAWLSAFLNNVELVDAIKFQKLIQKVIIPMFSSPILAFLAGIIIMVLILWLFMKARPNKANMLFRRLQLLSSGFFALSHGTNDAQKTMGVISISLFLGGFSSLDPDGSVKIPLYVVILCACIMAIGTMSGGWKIIKTMGHKVAKLKPIHGFAAESSSAILVMGASHIGIPLSTTQMISGSIMGVGTCQNSSKVKWSLVKSMVIAWVITIPASAIISAVCFFVVHLVF